MTRNDWLSGLLGLAFLLTLVFMPVQAPQPQCYRNRAGVVVCAGQQPAGGSGITPVKRFRG